MASPEDVLMDLAETISREHGLSVYSMLKLADTLEQLHADAAIPCITFPNLVHLLSDTDHAVPEWLAASTSKMDRYRANQFNAVIKLIEARYWLGSAEQVPEHIWPWQIVFGQPRHVHRQVMSKRDAQNLVKLPGLRGHYSFTNHLPKSYYEDFPDAYKILRDTSFPHGIDDAIPAFVKHFCRSKTAVSKLRKRINALLKAGVIRRTCKIFLKAQKVIADAESIIRKTMTMAQRWHAATKKQKEYYQLPGVDLGLPYGTNVFAEYDSNKAFVIHTPRESEGGNTHWDAIGPIYTPIRWRPGSAWLDYFRNTRQDHPLMRHFKVDDLEKDADLYRTLPGPYDMRLPQSFVNIWMHYARMYDSYESTTNGHPRGKTKDELDAEAKRLSDATGEPYWRVRPIRIEYGSISMYFPHNAALAGRPRYDALGNLRFDYMGAILKELKTGQPPRDYRTQQSLALLRADCDDDTEMGEDLAGSE